MDLPRGGIEYARITFNQDVSTYTVEVSVDGEATWLPTVPGDTGFQVKVLLRGPAAGGTAGTLITATTVLHARVTDSPEIIPLRAGVITLI